MLPSWKIDDAVATARGNTSLSTKCGNVADNAGAEKARADPVTNKSTYTGATDGVPMADQMPKAARQRVFSNNDAPMIRARSNRSAECPAISTMMILGKN